MNAAEDGPVSLYASAGGISSLYVPAEADSSSVPFWYWPGHGFQTEDGTLFVTMAKLYQCAPGKWGFRGAGVDILKVDPVTFEPLARAEMFDRSSVNIAWAQCLLHDGDAVYVYGSDGFGGFYAWRTDIAGLESCFENGAFPVDENAMPEGAVRCEGVDVGVSSQHSVFRHGDKYVLVTMNRLSGKGDMYSFISDNPMGPWYGKKLLYTATEQEDKELFTYNTMAHPQFINSRGELLICYNINSFDVERIFREVRTYRPVFLRVPMKYILGE